MTLPASFSRDGFQPLNSISSGKFKRLLIGTDGWAGTGKTEFIMSAPEPIIMLCLDRGIDAPLDNPHPPKARAKDIAVKVIKVPLPTQLSQPQYLEAWRAFYNDYIKALDNPDVRTVGLDGDSDSWELQRLAEWGRVIQVPSLQYPNVNAARKAMIARAWESGKIVIATNKLEHEYKRYTNKEGKEVSEKTGNIVRQGFKDYEYLWQVQLRHVYDKEQGGHGIRVWLCKHDKSNEGLDLWGEDANFQSLVQVIYPEIPLEKWGYR